MTNPNSSASPAEVAAVLAEMHSAESANCIELDLWAGRIESALARANTPAHQASSPARSKPREH